MCAAEENQTPDVQIVLKIQLRKTVRPGELSPKSAESTREGNCGANEAVWLTIDSGYCAKQVLTLLLRKGNGATGSPPEVV